MKTLVIMRFGIPNLLPHEKPIFDTIGAESKVGVIAAAGHIGYIGIFKTGFSPNEVVHMFTRVAEEKGDRLPVIVTELDKMNADFAALNFQSLVDAYHEAEETAKAMGFGTEPQVTKCELSLDELLDLVSAKGIQNLTPEETMRLQELSK